MLFRRRQKDRQALSRLTRWALDESVPQSELERMYGRDHSEELGALGWLFRAIECRPHEEPSLGLWQRFESELRERLRLLPPPRPHHAMVIAPLVLLPSALTGEARAALTELACKAAAVTAATAAISAQIVMSGVLDNLDHRALFEGSADVPAVNADITLTGNVFLDHMERNRVALEAGDLGMISLSQVNPP